MILANVQESEGKFFATYAHTDRTFPPPITVRINATDLNDAREKVKILMDVLSEVIGTGVIYAWEQ